VAGYFHQKKPAVPGTTCWDFDVIFDHIHVMVSLQVNFQINHIFSTWQCTILVPEETRAADGWTAHISSHLPWFRTLALLYRVVIKWPKV